MISATDVTVVIPAFNSAHFLRHSLGSLLRQTSLPGRIVVVDDGSADDPGAAIRSMDPPPGLVELVSQPNRGLAAARNRGLAEAATAWVAFLDADDLWHPQRLERMVAYLQQHPEVRALATSSVRFHEQGHQPSGDAGAELDADRLLAAPVELPPLDTLSAWSPTESHFWRHNWLSPNLIVDRALMISSGGFPTHVSITEDWLAWVNLIRMTSIVILEDPTFYYRQQDGSMSRTTPLPFVWLLNLVAQRHSGRGVSPPGARDDEIDPAQLEWLVRMSYAWAADKGGPSRRAVRRLAAVMAPAPAHRLRHLAFEVESVLRCRLPGVVSTAGRSSRLRSLLERSPPGE